MSKESVSAPVGGLNRVTKMFERIIVVSLVVMLMLVVALSTVDLGWTIAKNLLRPPHVLIDVDELLGIFSMFLLILIGVELLETVKAYLRDSRLHVEIVLEVALIAIARKIVVLDLAKYDGLRVLALAALIIALTGALIVERRRAHQ
jgi:uncharacterized membrane protein (DUF373 family)